MSDKRKDLSDIVLTLLNEKNLEEAGRFAELIRAGFFLDNSEENEQYKDSIDKELEFILKRMDNDQDQLIITTGSVDTYQKLTFPLLLIVSAHQSGKTDFLERVAKHYQYHHLPRGGYIKNALGVMLIQSENYKMSETCFSEASSCFRQQNNLLGTAVVTLNQAALWKVSGNYRKALTCCHDVVMLSHDIKKTKPFHCQVATRVSFRVANLLKEFGDYNSYHKILSIGEKCDTDCSDKTFSERYLKELMTLQLKEKEGKQIKRGELEEFTHQLFSEVTIPKAGLLNADFVKAVLIVAEMYFGIGCLEKAWNLIEKLEWTFLNIHGGNCPLYGFLLYQVGLTKFRYGEASEAQVILLKAEEIFICYFGGGYHMVSLCKSLQGTCALLKGNQKEARHLLNEARTQFEKIDKHHPEVGGILLKFAELESKDGNFENANLIIEEALEIVAPACGKVSLQTALAYLQGASILQRKREFMLSALNKVKKANYIFVYLGLPHDHPDVAFCHFLKGQLLFSVGQVKEAEEEFRFVHHQLSSQDELSMKTKVIAPELTRMFIVVDGDGYAITHSLCTHFLSLISLADMKMGDEKRGQLRELFSCFEGLDTEVLTVSDYAGKHVHCKSQRSLEADIHVNYILMLNSLLNPFQINEASDFSTTHATPLTDKVFFSSPCSDDKNKTRGDYVYLLSPSGEDGKRPQLLLFWKTSKVLEKQDLSCVSSSLQESVKLLCLQPKLRKAIFEEQEFWLKVPVRKQLPVVSSLCFQIDCLPLLVELELSELHNHCFTAAPAVWPFAHVPYFSYSFFSTDKALLSFYKLISSLGRTLELSEGLCISTVKVPSPSQMKCAVHFTFSNPICASLSLAVKEGSVHVKCRTVKNSGSTCICSSVKSALESTLKSLELKLGGSAFEPTLWLPCVADGSEHGKEQARCYSHRKEFQKEASSSDQNLDLLAQTKWVPNSGKLKIGPSVDLSQNEDTKSLLFTAIPGDKIGIDVCVNLMECIMRNRPLSLEVQPAGLSNDSLTTDGSEEHVNSLLSPGLSLPLNCLPSSQYDSTNEKQEVMQKGLPCLEDVHKETCSGKETGIISDTLSTSLSSSVNSHYHESAPERSNCEEGLIADYHESLETKDNLVPNEIRQETYTVKRVGTCFNKEESREDHGIEFDQSPGPSFAAAGRENDKGTVDIGTLVCKLQDEVAFYQDQCQVLREELVKLKEKLKLCEDEKQDLQTEVGRQLFLESKERRCNKIYQPPSEHASGTSMPGRIRGASHDFSVTGAKLLGGAGPLNESGVLLQQRLQEISNSLSEVDLNQIKHLVRHKLNGFRLARIREGSGLFEELERIGEFSCFFIRDLLERIHRFDLAEKLAVPFHNSDKSYRRESCSLQGSKQLNEVSESVSGVDSKQSDEVEERRDIYDNTEPYGEIQFCNSSYVHPLNSEREVAADTFHVEIVNESSFVGDKDLSKERCHSASSMFQSFDVPSIGVESEERSLSPSVTGEQFESGELKGACGAGDKGGREGSYESSGNDGAEGQFSFNHHFNDTVDGVVNLPDGAQDRSVPEDVTGVNQDSLPCGDKTQSLNGSSARIMAQKDRAIDQSDSHVGNHSHKWEHLGARPRDRPKTDTSPEPSLLCSLENLVPPQVAEPLAHGVANAFLARHSQDKNLHESLYYTNAEMMLTENSSLQGASHADGMMNLMDSTRAKLNFGDCQFSSRQDSHHQPHSSLFPQTGGANIGGNNGLNTNFNLLNPNIANDFAPCTRMQDGTSPFLQRDELLHSGFTVSGLTSDFMGATGSQTGAFNLSNSYFSVNDYALGTREPQIPPDGHVTSLQSNRPIHLGFNGSGLSFDLTETTGHKMSHSATGNGRKSDFIDSASMLPLTTNPVLLGTSSVNMQTYDYHPDASPTASSDARVNGSDSRLLSGIESSGSSQLLPVTTGRDVLNTSDQGNCSSNAMDTSGDHLASAHYREGSRAHNFSSSGLISGTNTGGSLNQQSGQNRDSVTNRNYGTESVESTDNSLLELEQRVEEACAMVERVLREREESEEFGREIERKEREIRAERARKKREREARELEEARGWPQQQEPVTGQSLWLCEHYQRHCRVRFPCCTNFYSCHRCHNNSKECDNEEAKASHATHLKCSYCHHEQEIGEDSAKCRSCGAKMSAYFCAICKHFTSIDKNPYHCEKCGICRIHKDKSFHCDVCNVCLDKRLQGKHKCRPDSGHDECCICLEDAFSGCQILPCSHKVHRECAIAMIQNGIRTCPVCRHPLYSPAPE